MEEYKIRKGDMLKPLIGYLNYVDRNWDTLPPNHRSSNISREDEIKTMSRTLGLAAWHFMILPGIALYVVDGLDKLLS